MPSLSALFRRHRSSKTAEPPPNDDGKTSRVLKKRSRILSALLSDPRRATVGNGPAGGGQTIGRPYPCRNSTSAMPDLPSLPIYQTFASRRRMSLLSNDQLGRSRTQQVPRLGAIADSHDTAGQPARTLSHTTPTSEYPPVYDRSAELARYYRSVLPDSQAVWGEEEGDKKKETSDGHAEDIRPPAMTRQHSYYPLPLAHDGTHIEDGLESGASSFGTHRELPSGPTDDTCNVIAPTLALPEDQELVAPSKATTQPDRPDEHATDESENQWPLRAEENMVQDALETMTGLADPFAEPMAEPIAELEADSVVPPIPTGHPNRLSRISQYGPVGLHVCADLLSEQLIEQLTKALSLKDQQRARGMTPDDSTQAQDQWEPRKRLQILLLIESYEDLFKSCSKGGVLEKKMVPILEHWLESLHAVYDQAFPDGQVEGGGGIEEE